MACCDSKTDALLNVLGNGGSTEGITGSGNTKTQNYLVDAINRVQNLEDEVERLENNPDVADIVATYSDLENYDKTQLTDKDVIRVLQDSTHNDESTYYRYDAATGEFTYIGTSKQYTNFVGTDGTVAGQSGLVPAPAVTDADKFLKSDGTWAEAGGGGGGSVNVVQTTGTSQTDVMSQNAVTSMVFDDPSTRKIIKIGNQAAVYGSGATAVSVGYRASARGDAVCIGESASADKFNSVAIGSHAKADTQQSSVALGYYATTTRKGEVNVGAGNSGDGYNSTNYRVIGGVHDPADAHDAATKGYVDANSGYNINSQDVQSAYQDPGVPKSLSVSEYEALENVCVNLGKLYFAIIDAGVYTRCDDLSYECNYGSSIGIYSNASSINGEFSFSYNNGDPTVTFIPS